MMPSASSPKVQVSTFVDFQAVQLLGNIACATYGPAGQPGHDVTAALQALYQQGRKSLEGGIHTHIGDPFPGQPKILVVAYTAAAPSWHTTLAANPPWVHRDGKLATVSIGRDNALWGTNSQGAIYRSRGVAGAWEGVPGGLVQVDAYDFDTAVGVNSNGDIYHFHSGSWHQLPGQATWAAIGNNGAIWVVNSGQQIFTLQGGNWVNIPGAATSVSVGDEAWVVNAQGSVYKYQGSAWAQVAGPPGKQVAKVAASGDRVVATATDDTIYAYAAGAWVLVPGGMRNIGVNGSYVVGQNSIDDIYTATI